MPPEQKFLELKDFDPSLKEWLLGINPFFWAVDDTKQTPSFVVKYRLHKVYPSVEELIRAGARMAALMPNGMIVWNGPARSIGTHAHFQGVLRKYPVAAHKLVASSQEGDMSVANWPVRNYAFEGPLSEVITRAQEKVRELKASGLAENMIDLSFDQRTDGFMRIVLVPRRGSVPHGFKTALGVSQILGYFLSTSHPEELAMVDTDKGVAEVVAERRINLWLQDVAFPPLAPAEKTLRVAAKPVDQNPVSKPGSDTGFRGEMRLREAYAGVLDSVLRKKPVADNIVREFTELLRINFEGTVERLRSELRDFMPMAFAEMAEAEDGFAGQMEESVRFRTAHQEYDALLSLLANESLAQMEKSARAFLKHNDKKGLRFAFAMRLPAEQWFLAYLQTLESLKGEFGDRVSGDILILARKAQLRQEFVKRVQRSGFAKIVEPDGNAALQLGRFLSERPNALAFDMQDMLGSQFAERSVRLERVLWKDVYPIATPIVLQAAQVTQITADLLNKIARALPGNAAAFRNGQLVILEAVLKLILDRTQAERLFSQMA